MIESLHIASTGMHAQQTQVDVIANNLANVNTTGFKKSKVSFEDLMYREIQRAGTPTAVRADQATGAGAAVADVTKVFSVGDAKKTDAPLDLAIRGDGFFEVMLPDGGYAYTRTGTFKIDNEGQLVNSDGYVLSPAVQVPVDAQDIVFGADGTVRVKLVDERELVEIGRLELARFVNPGGLGAMGDNLYLPTHESGDVIYARPGEDGAGTLAQGYLEASNVEMVEELTNLILAQRAYEINSKVVQAADELLSIVNNLRR